jgi:Ras-related GTP-binding protein A/B
MDLIEDPEQKQLIFEQKRKQLEDLAREYSLRVEVSKTSIWDKTLYSAWSKIVTQLVPNKEKFEVELEALAEKSGADEGNIINEILKETVKKIY